MLTLVTGTPGAGKSLYTVWEIARKVPGSTVESDRESVPRRLFSNIKDLLLDHQHITGDDLNRWHEWVKPGDVIVFDEVQEVWRPRGVGSKVPECIAKLETHRHMGVDIVLITQHPMLVDPNIRRLVNQHLHLRRITKTVAMVYEWDHCENPGNTRATIGHKVWMHPKAAYKLYKSAQLHTKPTARVPAIAWVGLLALCGLAYAGPMAYGRISGALGKKNEVQTVAAADPSAKSRAGLTTSTVQTSGPPPGYVPPEIKPSVVPVAASEAFSGCVASPVGCGCFNVSGARLERPESFCREHVGADRPPALTFPDTPVAMPPSQSELDSVRFAFLKNNRAP